MSSVVMLAARAPLTQRVLLALTQQGLQVSGPVHPDVALVRDDPAAAVRGVDAIVYMPATRASGTPGPDLTQARRALSVCAQAGVTRIVLVSSAEAYGASPRNPGLIAETRAIARDAKNAISSAWLELEAIARELLQAHATLSILRPCPVPVRAGADYFSRLLSGGVVVTLAGHDPSIQLLHPDDLARAIACAVARSEGGVFNVAPDSVIPLSAALELSRGSRLPVLRDLQRHARSVMSAFGLADSVDQLEYIRFSFTVSNQKIKKELGFAPTRSSAQALRELIGSDGKTSPASSATEEFDDFGLDKDYVAAGGRVLFDFLARHYWRIEVEGLEHVPAAGRGVLAGLHRGLIAWDGVMILHLLAERMQRYPRFLVHPAGFQFPYVFDFTTKLGGVVACQENADYVLEHDELVGIFPEGIRGVFSLYKEAYQLRKFGRHDFVKIALRHGAPIIPFVIVGSAETYPIVGKIEWSWFTRKTGWPFFPITPTLIPTPLPAKWQIRFLPAIELDGKYPPEAAKKASVVRAISDAVKKQMEDAITEITGRRESVFLG